MVFLGLVLLEINLYTGFIYEKIVISKDKSNLYKNGFRNIRLELLCQHTFLKSFAKFTRKHLRQSLFL